MTNPVIVMELGAQRCQLGISTERAPRASVLTLLGRPKGKVAQRIPDLREYYVGEEAELKANLLHVRHPLRHGMVDSWDDMVLLWKHAFRDLLRIPPEEHPVLLTEPPLVPTVNREKMTQVLFETFQVPAMYVALQQLLTVLSVGLVHGTVVDSGYDATYIVPVFDGCALQGSRLELGGRGLTELMSRRLRERGLPDSVSQTRSASLVKENVCFVAEDWEIEKNRQPLSECKYQLPDGQVVTVAEERFHIPEALFRPTLLDDSDTRGIHYSIAEALNACDTTQQASLAANLVLAGGSSRFPGLAHRLRGEVSNLTPNLEWNVREPVVAGRPEPSAWLGGAILASLPSFQSMFITRQEYEEQGPSVVHKKCDHL